MRISPLHFLAWKTEWHPRFIPEKADTNLASRTDHVSLLASMESDTSQGSERSGAFVPQEESHGVSAELWVTHSTWCLTSALPQRPDMVRRGLNEEAGQALTGHGKAALASSFKALRASVAEQGKLRTDSRGICRVLDQLSWTDSLSACQYGSHQPTWLLSTWNVVSATKKWSL